MAHHVANKDGPLPRAKDRLEGWLVRKIHAGGLERLPSYFPLGRQGAQSPEQFALALLAELRRSEGDPQRRERLEDDARAFRSWAESAPVTSLRGNDVLTSLRIHGRVARV
jgi:hypothetical protein